MSMPAPQVFLFLQGPVSPFFARLAGVLEARGHRVLRVNLCLGDRLVWLRPGGIDYRGDLQAWPAWVGRLMDREGVTDLVFLGEQRAYHKTAAAEAARRDVTVTATDFGYLRPDWLTLEHDGMNGLSRFPRTPAAIRALAAEFPAPDLDQRFYADFAPQARWDVQHNLATWFGHLLYPGYRTHQIYNPVLLHLSTALRLAKARASGRKADAAVAAARAAGEPYWLFPMQMEVDFSIRAYSAYSGMDEPLREVIGSFARAAPPNGRLFIKVHPFDPGLRDWARTIRRLASEAGVAERVSYFDGGRLEAMIEGAEGVVTINSTVGLMALQAQRPTKTLGQAIYDVDSLTFQGPLDQFWTNAVPPEPELMAALIRAAAGALHIRGLFFNDPGMRVGIEAAADRLQAARSAEIAAAIERALAAAAFEAPPARRRAG